LTTATNSCAFPSWTATPEYELRIIADGEDAATDGTKWSEWRLDTLDISGYTFTDTVQTVRFDASALSGTGDKFYLDDVRIDDYDGFTPLDLPAHIPSGGLQLWLDGDDLDGDGMAEGLGEDGLTGSVVDTWTDKSGKGRDAMDAGTSSFSLMTNTLNGRAVVNSGGTGQIEVGGSAFAAQTVVAVINASEEPWTRYRRLLASYTAGNPGGGSAYALIANGGDGASIYSTLPKSGADDVNVTINGIDSNPSGNSEIFGSPHSAHRIVAAHAGSPTLFVSDWSIGENSANHWLGYIAEILVYSRALNAEEINTLGVYLEEKWGIDSAYEVPFDFTTLNPASGAGDVAIDADLVITFNESVQTNSGSITIKQASDSNVVETISIPSAQVAVSGAMATINPSGSFLHETGYYVEISSNAFAAVDDAEPFAGITGSDTWAFTTESAPPTATLITSTDGNGSFLSFVDGDYAVGSTVTVDVVANDYYHWGYWTGDVPPVQTNDKPLELVMDVNRTITANFVENLATNGVPQWWLAQYGWTNNFDQAGMADTDGDLHQAWQEYIAGTDPTNPVSVLRIVSNEVESVSGNLVLSWPSAEGREYYVQQTDELGGLWWLASGALPATPPMNTHTQDINEQAAAFHRVVIDPPMSHMVDFSISQGYTNNILHGQPGTGMNWTEETPGTWQVDAANGTATIDSNDLNYRDAELGVTFGALTAGTVVAEFTITAGTVQPASGISLLRSEFSSDSNSQALVHIRQVNSAENTWNVQFYEAIGEINYTSSGDFDGTKIGLEVNGGSYTDNVSDLLRLSATYNCTDGGTNWSADVTIRNLDTGETIKSFSKDWNATVEFRDADKYYHMATGTIGAYIDGGATKVDVHRIIFSE
jgi:hypothetical protein